MGRRCGVGPGSVGEAAFTLPELLIASTIFLMLVGAILSSTLYGLRSQAMIEPRQAAEEMVRRVKTQLLSDVQRAGAVRIGTGNELGVVTPVYGVERRGPALELRVGTNILTYFIEDHALKFSTNASFPEVLAVGLTADSEFRAEDLDGSVMTFDCERTTVGVTLRFDQVQMGGGALPVGDGEHFTDYQLVFSVAQRGG